MVEHSVQNFVRVKAVMNRLFIKTAKIVLLLAAVLPAALPVHTALAADDVLSSSVYTVNRPRGVLTGVAAGTSAAQLIAGFDNASGVMLYGGDNREYTGGAVATGMRVQLTVGGAQKDALRLAVNGDTSGDGQITILDYTLIRLFLLSRASLDGEFALAGDVNSDGQITILDYTLLRMHLLGIKPIPSGSGGGAKPLAGRVIGLDPGHQSKQNSALEPESPGSSTMKKKVSSGTQGRFTGVAEYIVNLQVGLKLKARLEELGAAVVMTRVTHDVDISNAQRAVMMNNVPVDCWLRIHADGNNNPGVYGMSMLVAADGCMNTADPAVLQKSVRLGQILLDSAAAHTGAKSNGVKPRTDQTGFNWSSVPVCNIEMGYMTNEAEDRLLVTDDYQNKIVEGLVAGFITYFPAG